MIPIPQIKLHLAGIKFRWILNTEHMSRVIIMIEYHRKDVSDQDDSQ